MSTSLRPMMRSDIDAFLKDLKSTAAALRLLGQLRRNS
jgi:hypothetical protein